MTDHNPDDAEQEYYFKNLDPSEDADMERMAKLDEIIESLKEPMEDPASIDRDELAQKSDRDLVNMKFGFCAGKDVNSLEHPFDHIAVNGEMHCRGYTADAGADPIVVITPDGERVKPDEVWQKVPDIISEDVCDERRENMMSNYK